MQSNLFNKPLVHIFLIALLGLLAYSNTFNAPFVFDDEPNIEKTPLIRDFSCFWEPSRAKDVVLEYNIIKKLPFIFTNRIVGYFSFALNYRFGGLDVRGYHALNLAVHIINALLVYWLVLLTFRTPFMEGAALKEHKWIIALFSALVFVSHPAGTQAVTYIVQRFTSLAVLFCLLSITSYARARLSMRKATEYMFYSISLASAVLAMKTKEIAFTLPAMVAVYELFFFGGNLKRRFLCLFPLFLTMLIIPMGMLGTGKPLGELLSAAGEATRLQTGMPRLEYLFTEFRVIVTYLRLLVLPMNQNLDYDYPTFTSFFDPQVFLSFLFLVSIFCLGVYLLIRSRRSEPALRVVSFGILWFFITLSVESSIIPITDVIFEHRVYLPGIGAIFAVVTAVFLLFSRVSGRKTMMVAIMCVAMISVALAVATYSRNNVWKSRVSLWEDVVMKSPGKLRGHFNLGKTYLIAGVPEKAIEHFKIAVKLDPKDVVDAHLNLGLSYEMLDLTDKAMGHYRRALSLKPDHAEAYSNIGNIYLGKGEIDSAIENYRIALGIKPDFLDAHYNMGIAYYYKGLLDKAIEHYKIALSIKPDDAEVHNNLGAAYLKLGLTEEARQEFERALKIDPSLHEAREFLRRSPPASTPRPNEVRYER